MNTILDNGTHKIETSGILYRPSLEDAARVWRDNQLAETDSLVAATDHPKHDEIMTYRQALRDWPETDDFPTIKPVSPI